MTLTHHYYINSNILGFQTLPPPKKRCGPMPYQLLLAWSSDKLMLVSQYLQKLLHSISKEKKKPQVKNTDG